MAFTINISCPGDVILTLQYNDESFEAIKAAALVQLKEKDKNLPANVDLTPALWAISATSLANLDHVTDQTTLADLCLAAGTDVAALRGQPGDLQLYMAQVNKLEKDLKAAVSQYKSRLRKEQLNRHIEARGDDSRPSWVKQAEERKRDLNHSIVAAGSKPQKKKETNGTQEGSLASFMASAMGVKHTGASSGMIKAAAQADQDVVSYHKSKEANKEMAKAFGDMIKGVAKSQGDRAAAGKVLSASQIAAAEKGK